MATGIRWGDGGDRCNICAIRMAWATGLCEG